MNPLEGAVEYRATAKDRGNLGLVMLGVEFLRDFGPWRKGEQMPALRIDFLERTISNGGKTCKFIIAPELTEEITNGTEQQKRSGVQEPPH